MDAAIIRRLQLTAVFAALAALPNASTPAAASSESDLPRIVSTSPAEGSTIAPGAVQISATFSEDMLDGSFSLVRSDAGSFPQCAAAPKLSADRRTFTLACITEPGQHYEIWFNRMPYVNFRSASTHQPAAPYRLRFVTGAR